MKKRILGLIIMLMLILARFSSCEAISYSTLRLQSIARLLPLSGIDTLSPGESFVYSYHSRPLVIRVNEWKEVEHIGFRIFSKTVREFSPSVVYDFLERYLLELELFKGTDYAGRFGLDNVTFEVGSVETVLNLDGTESFSKNSLEFKYHRLTWSKEGKEIAVVSFEADNQLLTGCNSVELEALYLKRLRRFRGSEKIRDDLFTVPENVHGDFYRRKGEFYLKDAICNDLYYMKTDGQWKLVSDSARVAHSIANMLLSVNTDGNYDLDLTLDKYGYEEERETLSLRRWLEFCLEENCVLYFGMKGKQASLYLGTLFAVNRDRGFVHMLEVTVPKEILKNKRGTISGRLFSYIPLHNVSKDFFNYQRL